MWKDCHNFFKKQYKIQNICIEREKSVESIYQLCFFVRSFFFLLDLIAFSAIFAIYIKHSAHAYVDTTVSINERYY